MNISNLSKALIEQTVNINELWVAVQTTKSIIKKYGQQATGEKFLTVIKEADTLVHELIQTLVGIKAFNRTSIEQLYTEIEQAYNKSQNITYVESSINNQNINQSFDNVQQTDKQTIGLKIKTTDKIYKRTLDTDLEKLLA